MLPFTTSCPTAGRDYNHRRDHYIFTKSNTNKTTTKNIKAILIYGKAVVCNGKLQ